MPRPRELDAAQRAALDALASSRSLLLASHVRPDGDGVGSEAALARVLASMGKEVHVVNPDPPEARFDFFTEGLDLAAWSGGGLPEHDLSVLLDISELSRCGGLGEAIAAAPSRKMVIDHHVHHGEAWWDHAFVDVGASATGVLVHRIARALGVRLDRPAATAIFVSISSDTGWFKYGNTDAETLAAVAELVEAGVKPDEVYAALHQRHGPDHPRLLAELLGRTAYHAGHRVAVVDLPASRSHVAEAVDSDLALDVLRAVEEVEVVIYVRESADGTCKLSLRSKTDFDVNAVARRLGGGGHVRASGATLPGPLDESVERVLAETLSDLGAGSGGETR